MVQSLSARSEGTVWSYPETCGNGDNCSIEQFCISSYGKVMFTCLAHLTILESTIVTNQGTGEPSEEDNLGFKMIKNKNKSKCFTKGESSAEC